MDTMQCISNPLKRVSDQKIINTSQNHIFCTKFINTSFNYWIISWVVSKDMDRKSKYSNFHDRKGCSYFYRTSHCGEKQESNKHEDESKWRINFNGKRAMHIKKAGIRTFRHQRKWTVGPKQNAPVMLLKGTIANVNAHPFPILTHHMESHWRHS